MGKKANSRFPVVVRENCAIICRRTKRSEGEARQLKMAGIDCRIRMYKWKERERQRKEGRKQLYDVVRITTKQDKIEEARQGFKANTTK